MFEIGPNVVGTGGGTVNLTSATLYMALSEGNDEVSYASYSTDAGHTWNPLINNVAVPVAGSNPIQFTFTGTQDAEYPVAWKLVFGVPV